MVSGRCSRLVPGQRSLLFGLLGVMVVALAASFGNLKLAYGLASARRALRGGDPNLAVAVLEQYADRGATSAEWQRLLLRSLRRAGRMDEAQKQLDAAEEVIADPADVRREKLLLQARKGQVKKLEPKLAALLRSGVNDETAEDIYEAMAQGYWTSYHVGDALRCLEFWSKWQTDNVAPRLWIAELYLRTERTDEAIDAYRGILEIDPNNTDALSGLGQLLVKKLEISEGAEMFARCLVRSPEHADSLLGLADCRRRQGGLEDVKDLLYDLLTLDLTPQQAGRAAGMLGTMALEERDYIQAVRLLREAILLEPDEVTKHESLATALVALGDDDGAAAERRRSRDITDRRERLTRAMRKVLENPEDADLRCEVGLIYIEAEKWHAGADWLLSALQINPGHRAAHDGLAKYFELTGDREKARQHRESAGRAVPAAASKSEGG